MGKGNEHRKLHFQSATVFFLVVSQAMGNMGAACDRPNHRDFFDIENPDLAKNDELPEASCQMADSLLSVPNDRT